MKMWGSPGVSGTGRPSDFHNSSDRSSVELLTPMPTVHNLHGALASVSRELPKYYSQAEATEPPSKFVFEVNSAACPHSHTTDMWPCQISGKSLFLPPVLFFWHIS